MSPEHVPRQVSQAKGWLPLSGIFLQGHFMNKRITRIIVVEGDAGWIDSVMEKSIMRKVGDVKMVHPACTIRCEGVKTEIQEKDGTEWRDKP